MTDLYELAKKYFVDTQNKQIQKGLNTYGKPLDPFEWTPDQLLQHAVDETVDDLHYKVALAQLAKAAFARIAELEAFVKTIAEDGDYYNAYEMEAQDLMEKSLVSPPKPIFVKGTISKEEAMKMLDVPMSLMPEPEPAPGLINPLGKILKNPSQEELEHFKEKHPFVGAVFKNYEKKAECEHHKRHEPFVLTSNPPKQRWECILCGEKGIDTLRG